MSANTRDQFLKVAIEQFADRGFYGTSIASIASELGLTKQALLHHFGSKEKLYAEILKQISAKAIDSIEKTSDISNSAERLEEIVVQRFQEEMAKPDEARLLMRELLDNEQRAENAGNWYLKPYLDELVTLVTDSSKEKLSQGEALALAYQLLGAANYFAMSRPTLKHMFGPKTYTESESEFITLLRKTVRQAIK